MIVLPGGLVSTKFPGYFWDTDTKKLYSIKSGILKEVKRKRGFRHIPGGYYVSHNGIRYKYTDKYVSSLKHTSKVEMYPMQP